MSGLGSKKFMGETKSGTGDIISWKDDGKIIGFIHPKGFFPRKTYWLSFMRENEEEEMELIRQPFVCPGIENRCPICELREFLKEHSEIEDDETIYEVGKKKKKVEIMKGDALGLKDFSWRLSLIPNKEYLFGFVDVDNDEAGVGIIIASAGLGRAVSNCMESRMDDVGDEKGDPLKNPYAIKLRFKEKETPANKYKAYYNDAELTKEIKKLLEGEAPSIDNLIAANTPREIWSVIKDGLEVEGFEPTFLEHEEETDDEEKLKRKKKKVAKGKGSDGNDDEDAEEAKESSKKKKKLKRKKVKETDDDDEDDKPKKKKKLKRKIKKKEEEEEEPDEDMEPCPACNKNIPLSAKKCKYCGIEFDLTEENGDDNNDDNDNDDEKKKKCEYCGERVKSSLKRCPECGEKF